MCVVAPQLFALSLCALLLISPLWRRAKLQMKFYPKLANPVGFSPCWRSPLESWQLHLLICQHKCQFYSGTWLAVGMFSAPQHRQHAMPPLTGRLLPDPLPRLAKRQAWSSGTHSLRRKSRHCLAILVATIGFIVTSIFISRLPNSKYSRYTPHISWFKARPMALSSDYIPSRPRNSFFLVVANFCYQVQDQVAKLILW